MKERQKKILRFLLSHHERVYIEEIAELFSVGKRTVSRDLDSIEHWLSLRGGDLDRKPGQGILVQTFGSSHDELLDVINIPESYIESLSPRIRQKIILLYLLFNNKELKIADMANSFYISDTSVWNDLNVIERDLLPETLILERRKGVGIYLRGDEGQIRMEFLRVITELFSSKTIIPYLYALKEDRGSSLEINRLNLFLDRLHFPQNNGVILKAISKISQKLGYQFSISGEALLYFYLQLMTVRVKSGAQITWDYPCQNDYLPVAEETLSPLVERFFSGQLPRGESCFLGLILQVLEAGNVPEDNIEHLKKRINSNYQKLTLDLILEFGLIDNRLYYLNGRIGTILNIAVSSLVTRLQYGIPYWHGDWGDSSEIKNRDKKLTLLGELLWERFQVRGNEKDLDYILLYFQSFTGERNQPKQKMRCLVCCFEGIGLAAYLMSLLQREIDSIHVVEATAVFKVKQEYLDDINVDLVISTFPIEGIKTPLVLLSLPLKKELLIKEINESVQKIEHSQVDHPQKLHEFSFESVMGFIQSFKLINVPFLGEVDQTISSLSQALVPKAVEWQELAGDFKKREELGELIFEDYNTRVLHCKSSVTNVPWAGVVEGCEGQNRILYLVAPDPCLDRDRKILSTITISFMNNRAFRNALLKGTLGEIRRQLMDLYKDYIN